MAAKQKEYRRLPGTGTNLVNRSRLWLGTDHLLAVTSSGYSEDYKRFYFQDIQAFVLRPTRRGKFINIVFAVLAFLPLLGALSLSLGTGPNYGLAVFWGIIAGLLLACLVINTLLGPTCACHVKTAVQMEELPSLRRLWRAHKVLNRLQPLLVEAQGDLAPATREPDPHLTPALSPPSEASGEGSAFARLPRDQEESAGSTVPSAKSPGDSPSAVKPAEPEPPAAS